MNRALEAAFRLSCSLPSRIHRGKVSFAVDPQFRRIRRPVRVEGKEFQTVTIAAKKLKMSTKTIYRMLKDGRAVYLEALSGSSMSSDVFTRKA